MRMRTMSPEQTRAFSRAIKINDLLLKMGLIWVFVMFATVFLGASLEISDRWAYLVLMTLIATGALVASMSVWSSNRANRLRYGNMEA